MSSKSKKGSGKAASSQTPRPPVASPLLDSTAPTVDLSQSLNVAQSAELGVVIAEGAPSSVSPTESTMELQVPAGSGADAHPVEEPTVDFVSPAAPAEPEAASPPEPAGSDKAFTWELGSDGIAILRMDLPGEPVNTLQARFADDFGHALCELETAIDQQRVYGVVFVSGKKDSFLVGADINMLRLVSSAGEAAKLSQRGQAAMQRLEDLGRRVPVVAAIHGACLGGGLELALACTARVCSDDPKTSLGLPEVQLGLIPGAGGTQRLPRLIGIQPALDLILTGKQLKAAKALRVGLCDEVVPASILLQVAIAKAKKLAEQRAAQPQSQSLSLLGRLQRFARSLNPPGLRKLLLEDNPLGRKVLFDKARQLLLQKTRGHYPAPERALDVVQLGIDEGASAGYAAEASAFGGLVVSAQATQLIGIFLAQNALKKDRGSDEPSAAARPVGKVGVLGAGLMGAGVAYITASQAGASVRLKDKDAQGVGRGLKYARDIFDERVKKKSLPARDAALQMGRITPTLDYGGFADCQVVIEAVFEDLAVKQQVLRDLEAAAHPQVIFASNTSSLPITRIAEASAHPETVIGMHYFSPVHKMPLLEVIVTDKTAPWVTATCVELGKRQGKTVIVVRDGVGFYTSRILGPYMNEAAYLLAEGVPIERIDEALLDFGFPVGPLTLLDEVGIDVAEKVGHIVHKAFGDRLTPPPGIGSLVKNGRQGRKNGRGFYRYEPENGKSRGKTKGRRPVDTSIYSELQLPMPRPGDPGPVEPREVQFRCALAMINEAVLCLGEGILRSPRDGDIGAIFGLGFPPFLGGPFHWADSLGIGEVVRRLQELQRRFGARFAPAPLLVEMARAGKVFYPS